LPNKLCFLEYFTDVDILCLTETHLDASVPDKNLIEKVIQIFRRDKNLFGGGVLISASIVSRRIEQ